MKLTLYLVPGDDEGKLIKEFLEKNKLLFKEVISNDINILSKVAHIKL